MMFGARTKSALGQKQDPLSSSSIAGRRRPWPGLSDHQRIAWPKIGGYGACAIRASFGLRFQSAQRNTPRNDPIDFRAVHILASPARANLALDTPRYVRRSNRFCHRRPSSHTCCMRRGWLHAARQQADRLPADRRIDATTSLSSARVGEYISPPILACSLLWV